MYTKFTTQGIVLKATNANSSDRRLALFTQDFGLLFVHCSGARKAVSKFCAGTLTLSRGDYSLIKGKAGWRLVGVEALPYLYGAFGGHVDKLVVFDNVCRVIQKTTISGEKVESLYRVFSDFVARLAEVSSESVPVLEAYILSRILQTLGLLSSEFAFLEFDQFKSAYLTDSLEIIRTINQGLAVA